jgi:hypothetical protein
MMCEMCGEQPCRRSDQEYRESHPDDPWMVLCDECDTKCKGKVPARKGFGVKEEFGPKATDARLEYFVYELKLDTAVYLRLEKKKVPAPYDWVNALSDESIRCLAKECAEIKTTYGPRIYSRRGYQASKDAINRYKTICGTYATMASVGQFIGHKPESVKEDAVDASQA